MLAAGISRLAVCALLAQAQVAGHYRILRAEKTGFEAENERKRRKRERKTVKLGKRASGREEKAKKE